MSNPARWRRFSIASTVINNFDVDREHRTLINHGIDPQRITEVTHAPIRPIAIREANTRVPRGEQLGRDGSTLMVSTARTSPTAVAVEPGRVIAHPATFAEGGQSVSIAA